MQWCLSNKEKRQKGEGGREGEGDDPRGSFELIVFLQLPFCGEVMRQSFHEKKEEEEKVLKKRMGDLIRSEKNGRRTRPLMVMMMMMDLGRGG